MALDIYGGNPRIIAHFQELERISGSLELAAMELEEAWLSPPDLVLDLIPNPLPNLQLAIQLPAVIDRIRSFARGLHMAAQSYFSTEAQVASFLTELFQPYTRLHWFLSQPNPISLALNRQVTNTAATLAVLGLTGIPSFGKAQLVGQAVNLSVAASGGTSPRQLLANSQLNTLSYGLKVDGTASARLISTAMVRSPENIHGQVLRLKQNYWNPGSAVRIEAYRTAIGRDLVVYVPGTQSFLPGSKNPLNIPSNLTAMGNVVKAPSQQAVEDALKHLEAGQNDRVLFVGHSQGALIAGNIAEGPTPYQVMGLVSLGGPISHLNLDVPVIAIQHDSDPVPSLSGGVNPMRENWVTISSNQSFGSLVDAHKISSYAATALDLAGSQDEGYLRVSKLMTTRGEVGVEYLFELSLD